MIQRCKISIFSYVLYNALNNDNGDIGTNEGGLEHREHRCKGVFLLVSSVIYSKHCQVFSARPVRLLL